MVIGDGGEDTGLLQAGLPHELKIRRDRANPAGYLGIFISQLLTLDQRLPVFLGIEEKLGLADDAVRAAQAVE